MVYLYDTLIHTYIFIDQYLLQIIKGMGVFIILDVKVVRRKYVVFHINLRYV